MTRSILSLLTVALCLLSLTVAEGAPQKFRVLYITTTTGFHHSACEYSVPVFEKMAKDCGVLEVTASDKTDLITPEGLKKFDVVIFSNTSGGKGSFPLTDENGMALIDWVKSGKAFVGIHAATDTLTDWDPYVEMIGGAFNGHPWTKKVKVDIEDPLHPCAVPLPSPWHIDDEIYTFKEWSRDDVHVILSMDVSAEENKGNRDDRDYALAWCKPFGSGRVFYTALGHKHEVWDDPLFQKHLLAGVLWSLQMPPRETLRTIGLGFNAVRGRGRRATREHALSVGHAKPGDWVKIFDGKTLDWGEDWVTSGNQEVTRKHWTVQPGGILEGSSQGSPEGSSHLYYIGKKFRNFEYRAEVCINKNGNSGMYLRCQEDNLEENGQWKNWPRGYEAQVNNAWDPDPRKSGTFYPEPSIREPDLKRLIGYEKSKDDDNYWFTQHIIAVGNQFVIKLNDVVAIHHYDSKYAEGFFAYQMHHDGAVVKFKNIEVRELP